MTRRSALVRHQFVPGRWRDYRGIRICGDPQCGSLETDSVHKLPDVSDEQREHEARKVGERT